MKKLSSHQRIKATERYKFDFKNLMQQHYFNERMRYAERNKKPKNQEWIEYDLTAALKFMNGMYGIKR